MADEVKTAIETSAQGPASASVDGQSVTQHNLRDQIAADKYLASRDAIKSRRYCPIKFFKGCPGGTV